MNYSKSFKSLLIVYLKLMIYFLFSFDKSLEIAQEKRKPHAGLEPATFRLLSERSTN